MGLLSTILSILGFMLGLPFGLLVGYFLFIYRDNTDVKPARIRPISKLDTLNIHSKLSDFPLWVKSPDFERVGWLNDFLSQMWPYIDKAVCNIIRSTTTKIFEQYVGWYHIESIEFDQLTLGSIPPTFTGVKALETQEKELMLEAVIRWTSSCNVVVVLKCLSMKVPFQLQNLHVFAAVRITLKPLVPEFPCFENISISLIEKPHIDFGFKFFGGDIMAIPGLYRYIQEKIKEQVSSLFHWPQNMQLEMHAPDSLSEDAKKPVGILHVKVVRAISLQKMDFLGKSDPYVKLFLSGDRRWPQHTTVQRKNLNPVWNEQFKLIVKDPQNQVLELHVLDWDKMKMPDKIGMQVIPLNILVPSETKELTLNLLKNLNPDDPHNLRNRGKIVIEVKFNPIKEEFGKIGSSLSTIENIVISSEEDVQDILTRSGVLSLVVESAEDVEGKHHKNPYALVLFRGEQRRTKKIKNNRNPRWNQRFDFILEEPPINDKIRVEVMSSRKFSLFSKESLGYIEIDLIDVVRNGRINEKYYLIDSNNGTIHVEVSWSTVQ